MLPSLFTVEGMDVPVPGPKTAPPPVPALLPGFSVPTGLGTGLAALAAFNAFVFRIALASFTAYAVGQILDIFVFNRLRRLKSWWIAPTASTFAGNAIDTLLFFAVAFYASSDAFMAANWPAIAVADFACKIFIGACLFLPLYGVLLQFLMRKLTQLAPVQSRVGSH